jgi:taurine dioxygenase
LRGSHVRRQLHARDDEEAGDMAVELAELPGPIGAEIIGVDLRHPLRDDDVDALLEAFDRRHLLLARGQELSGPEQVGICRHFGPISSDSPEGYLHVSNARDDGVLREGALAFHSDFGFTHDPVHTISLFAIEVPDEGAPTLFADATGVLDRLGASTREQLQEQSIVNVFDFTAPGDRRMREREIAPGSPVVERRMIGRHPRTAAPVVQANAMHTDRIVGLSEVSSEAGLAELFASLYADVNVLVLDWQPGDFAIWDNIALQHSRPDFPASARRTMRRVCVHHKSTFELVPNILELVDPSAP